MPEIWPTELPCAFIRSTIEHQLGDNLLRSQTETGPGKQRPRGTSAAQPLVGAMKMTTAQWHTLAEFYRETLLEGSLVFTLPLAGEPGGVDVRFTKPPSRRDMAGGKWEVRLETEVMP